MNATLITVLENKLMKAGMGRGVALVWGSFLNVWGGLLIKAHGELTSDAKWAEFVAPISGRPHENDLTVGLYHLIEEIIDGAEIDDPIRDYEIKTEEPIPDQTRRGSRSRRADFKIKRRYANAKPNHLAVEAKRILAKSEIKSKFLGDEGLGCFLMQDSPYTRGPVGIMLAYTFHAIGDFTEDIVTAITNESNGIEIGQRNDRGQRIYIALRKYNRTSLKVSPIVIMYSSLAFPD